MASARAISASISGSRAQAPELIMRGVAAIDGVQELADLIQCEARLLGDADGGKSLEYRLVVDALVAPKPSGTEQTAALVVPDR